MPRILIVDDEPAIVRGLEDNLRFEGYETLAATSGEEGLSRALGEAPDLVLLDIMMPKLSGWDVCRELRRRGVDVPVIMLTARGDEADRIVGLELGADDYVTKPFSPRELAARVRTVLRRSASHGDALQSLEHGRLALDAGAREVTVEGTPVHLTAREFDLLWFLASHPRHVFSRDQLMDRVWGYEPAFDTGTVTVHIRRLREKIEPDPSRPRYLETLWGVGYRFTP